jgi:integrase
MDERHRKEETVSRGQGRVFRPKKNNTEEESAVWWLDYTVGGKRHRESSGMKSKTNAQRLLRERIGDRETGRLVGHPDRVTLAALRTQLEQRYVLKGNRSFKRAKQAFVHLERILGPERPVVELTQDAVNRYLEQRLIERAARATAGYEVGVLISALSAAVENRVLSVRPTFKLPRVRNARQGFFTQGDFAALLLELPPDVRPVVEFLHATGWRLNEALRLTWDQIDWEGQVIRISSDKTKGHDERVFPFGLAPDLKALLEARRSARNGAFVFHRSGRRIKTFIKAWRGAARRAGLAGRLVHDLRRTAARDFRRRGASEGEIMKLCGWKTRSMFDRYNIIDEADLAQAVAKRFDGNGKLAANSKASSEPEPSGSSSSTR